jgi:tRNA (pseudouridine54-N1)-methyltransferase
MHAFIILGHKAHITPDFTLNDLPGSAGRMDVLCRCINASLFLSHGLRRDVEVFLVLQDTVAIRISGQDVKRLNPDERSTAALIKIALQCIIDEPNTDYVKSTPGIHIAQRSLKSLLLELQDSGFEPVLLHESKSALRQAQLPEKPVFVLSDHMDFTEEELSLLSEVPQLSVGPNVYPASHCIVAVNHELDIRQTAIS